MIRMFIFFLFFLLYFSSAYSFEQRSDCVETCSHLDTSQEFGDCLSKCSRRPRKDNLADVTLFASPPKNIRIETNVIMDEGKILETTINWMADDSDIRRTGFYLRYTAVNSSCQKNFPGFFTSSISASERSLTIPFAFNGHSLIIDHFCTYRLQIRSIPYPAGDEKFMVEKLHTVPECIDNYCSCQDDELSNIEELKIIEENGNYRLKWKFEHKKQREYTFYIDIYEQIRLGFKPKNEENEFTFRIINQDPFEFSPKKMASDYFYSYLIPFEFQSFKQYKISIFAVDDRFCHNEDLLIFFNTTNTTIIRDSVIANIDFSTTLIPNMTMNSIESQNQFRNAINQSFIMESTFFLFFLISIACLSPLCTIIILFLIKRRQKVKKHENHFLNRRSLSCSRHSIMETNILYRPPNDGISPIEWKIRGQDIAVGTVIGEGAFGLVFKGILRGPNGQIVRVAVKQLKANALDEEKEEFIGEIQMMQTVGKHDNIVAMYGYCMDDNLQCMIMEYVPFGDLKHYIQNVRKKMSFSSSTRTIDESTNLLDERFFIDSDEFLSFSRQISNGMSHLESLGIIHRDLAARNILVGNGKILKISDFGMSRPGIYIKMSKGVIPLRWLSPEAIKDNTYSSKSDVWAYGVLLWEIATLGAFPYANIADKDILNHLIDGHRLERPPKCSEEMYNLMKSCWNLDQRDRPTFAAIFNQLNDDSSSKEDPPLKIEKNP